MKVFNLLKNIVQRLSAHEKEMDTPQAFGYTAVDSHFALDMFYGHKIGNYGIAYFRIHCTTALQSGGTGLNLITMDLPKAPTTTLVGWYAVLRGATIQNNYFLGINGKSIREGGNNAINVNDYYQGFIMFHM